MTTQERIDVMLAADAGKQIQQRHLRARYIYGWMDCVGGPSWNFFAFEYRVKPEPKTKTVYRLTYSNGSIRDFNAGSEALNALDFSVFRPTLQKIEIEL